MSAMPQQLSKVHTTEMLVTPDVAERFLARNVGNRPVSLKHVKTLAEAMSRGEWVLNGESLKFGMDGRLLDGQHRLLAVKTSNTPIRVLVTEGVPENSFATIDQGRKRTGGDVLSLLGVADPNVVSGACRIGVGIDAQQAGSPTGINLSMSGRMSNLQTVSYFQSNPGLNDWTWVVSEGKKLLPASIVLGMAHCISKYGGNQAKAKEFWEAFISGANLDETDPIFLLRKTLIGRRFGSASDRIAACAVVIKAWNMWITGQTGAKRLYFAAGREDFPSIFRAA